MIRPIHPPLRPNLAFIATILRLREWLPLTWLTLLGYVFTGPLSAPAQPVLIVAAGALYLAQGYGFNSIADAKTDPPERNPLARDHGSARSARLICSTLAVLGLAVCLAIGAGPALAFLAGIAINAAYSFPPLRLKRFFLSNLILNSAGFTALAFIGALARPSTVSDVLILGGIVFLSFVPYQLVHLFSHRQQDPIGGLPASIVPPFMISHLLLLAEVAFFSWHLGWPLLIGAAGLHTLAHLIVLSRGGDMRSLQDIERFRRWLRWMGLAWGIILLAVFYSRGV